MRWELATFVLKLSFCGIFVTPRSLGYEIIMQSDANFPLFPTGELRFSQKQMSPWRIMEILTKCTIFKEMTREMALFNWNGHFS
jgi:hypothetical protein